MWIRHLLHLQNLIQAGCRFGPNDLSPEEWDGLVALRHAQNDLMKEDQDND